MKPVLFASALLASSSLTFAARAIEGGKEDRATSHAVAIGVGADLTRDVLCSGTLISSNVVLTVRHCVDDLVTSKERCAGRFDGSARRRDLSVSADVTPLVSNAWIKVARAVVPNRPEICGNDVALLVLERPFDATIAVPARPVLSAASFAKALDARALSIAGFGATDGNGNGRGTRRIRPSVPVRCVPEDVTFVCSGELAYIASNEFTSGAGPCSGDSGAGALDPHDPTSVFGVLSRGHTERDACSEGVFERTDQWAYLIGRSVLEAAPSRKDAPAWAADLFPVAPKAGELCLEAAACGDGAECVSLDGERSFVCATRCESQADCGQGFRCSVGFCAHGSPPPGDPGGCSAVPSRRDSSSPTRVHGSAGIALASALVVVLRRVRARG